MSYLERVTECEHGVYWPHYLVHEDHQGPHVLKNRYGPDCPHCLGGSVRVDPDYEAAAEEMFAQLQPDDLSEVSAYGKKARAIVDAALGDTK